MNAYNTTICYSVYFFYIWGDLHNNKSPGVGWLVIVQIYPVKYFAVKLGWLLIGMYIFVLTCIGLLGLCLSHRADTHARKILNLTNKIYCYYYLLTVFIECFTCSKCVFFTQLLLSAHLKTNCRLSTFSFVPDRFTDTHETHDTPCSTAIYLDPTRK